MNRYWSSAKGSRFSASAPAARPGVGFGGYRSAARAAAATANRASTTAKRVHGRFDLGSMRIFPFRCLMGSVVHFGLVA